MKNKMFKAMILAMFLGLGLSGMSAITVAAEEPAAQAAGSAEAEAAAEAAAAKAEAAADAEAAAAAAAKKAEAAE